MPRNSSQASDIQQLKTDVALIRRDFKYQSQAMAEFGHKLEKIGDTVENLKYVPFDVYQAHLQAEKELMAIFDKRLTEVESYQEMNDAGVKFINKVVSNLLTAIALAATVALLGVAAWNVLKGVV